MTAGAPQNGQPNKFTRARPPLRESASQVEFKFVGISAMIPVVKQRFSSFMGGLR